MSFTSISVKEAIENINATTNGWFLPAVQRPYVWGSRYESEKYICRLFDSILRGYPIGTLIVWNSDKEIPYRAFNDHYADGITPPFADKNLWKREDKWLVYDGQQRLQTLFSCLKYTLNNRVLAYNLFFDFDSLEDTESNGFVFIDKNTIPGPGHIDMPSLFLQTEDGKVKYRNAIKATLPTDLLENNEEKFEATIDKLWDVFVRKDVKSLAYFPVEKSWTEDRVNDVFQRLNAGGVPLSGADLLLSKIKEKCYDYEEKLQLESKQIEEITQGYQFEPSTILQMVYFITKNTIRIDPDKVKDNEITKFIDVLPKFSRAFNGFAKVFLSDTFHINNNSIVPRGGALFPLIMYAYNRCINDVAFNRISAGSIQKMNQYFILSQVNDWNTPTIITRCSEMALNATGDFPLDAMIKFVGNNNRKTDLSVSTIENFIWFMLKVLTPKRSYASSPNIKGRYKPELDHIFPMRLKGRPENYAVNVVWNMQPVTGVINVSKSNMHPKTFFSMPDNAEYLNSQYDFMPDITSVLWDNHDNFISWRKQQMLAFLKSEYGLSVQET